jgi:glutathione S-transferase
MAPTSYNPDGLEEGGVTEREVPAALLQQLGIGPGVTLVQHPVSPFCIAVRALLEAAGAAFTVNNPDLWDRRPVIALTDGAYSSIPVLVDADRAPAVVVYEPEEEGQDVARYVDARYGLGVFPDSLAGLHDIVVQYVESQIEDVGFRLNDVFFLPGLPDVVERTMYIRHKERKFGRGCLDQWRAQAPALRARMEAVLGPLETMLGRAPYLFGERPVYADYILFGVLGNYLFTGHNRLPAGLTNLARWHAALPAVRLTR